MRSWYPIVPLPNCAPELERYNHLRACRIVWAILLWEWVSHCLVWSLHIDCRSHNTKKFVYMLSVLCKDYCELCGKYHSKLSAWGQVWSPPPCHVTPFIDSMINLCPTTDFTMLMQVGTYLTPETSIFEINSACGSQSRVAVYTDVATMRRFIDEVLDQNGSIGNSKQPIPGWTTLHFNQARPWLWSCCWKEGSYLLASKLAGL